MVLSELLLPKLAWLSNSAKAKVWAIERGTELSAVLKSSRRRCSKRREESYLMTGRFYRQNRKAVLPD